MPEETRQPDSDALPMEGARLTVPVEVQIDEQKLGAQIDALAARFVEKVKAGLDGLSVKSDRPGPVVSALPDSRRIEEPSPGKPGVIDSGRSGVELALDRVMVKLETFENQLDTLIDAKEGRGAL